MKKVLALVLAALMVAALCAGCGSTDQTAPTAAPAAETTAAPAGNAAAPAGDAAAPTAAASGDKAEGAPSGDKAEGAPSGDKAEGAPSGEAASSEAVGGQSGNSLPLETNAVIPTKASPETYTADEDGWKQYMLDCAYYAMGSDTDTTKLPATYYEIMNNGMTDMFVNMWGCDSKDAFIANGGVPTVNPWQIASGTGAPSSVPTTEATTAPAA